MHCLLSVIGSFSCLNCLNEIITSALCQNTEGLFCDDFQFFRRPVDTYNVALADPSGDGHMFLVTNALSVVSYWQFFRVTCHVEARRGEV